MIRIIKQATSDAPREVIEIPEEEFNHIEIDLDHGQTLWVHRPRVYWYLGQSTGAMVGIMGGPGALGVFHPDTGNTIIAAAVKVAPQKKEG